MRSLAEARRQSQRARDEQEAAAFEKLKQDKREEIREQRQASDALRDHTSLSHAALRALVQKADRFRHLQLLVRVGFAPWRRLVEHGHTNLSKAWQCRADRLRLWAWDAMVGHTVAQRTARIRHEYRLAAQATAHYRQKLMRHAWKRWSLHRKMLRAKATAIRGHFSQVTASKRAFTSWKLALERVRRRAAQQLRAVAPMGLRAVQRHYLARWRTYLEAERIDQEVRHRSAATWHKVQSWLKEGV